MKRTSSLQSVLVLQGGSSTPALLHEALLRSAAVACCLPDLPGVFTHVIPNAQGKLRQNIGMDPMHIEPSHVLGFESLPFFVGEAMARRERLRVLLVQRQHLLGTEQLNECTLQRLCTHIGSSSLCPVWGLSWLTSPRPCGLSLPPDRAYAIVRLLSADCRRRSTQSRTAGSGPGSRWARSGLLRQCDAVAHPGTLTRAPCCSPGRGPPSCPA